MNLKTKIKSILENINYTLLSNLFSDYTLEIDIEEKFHEFIIQKKHKIFLLLIIFLIIFQNILNI
jgi:hypothetical protein